MIGVLAFVVMGQAQPVMPAEEILKRLETPITFQSDPARLPVVLDQIGSIVGVRIRCEQALQPAVVVVSVRNRPAKELIKHLVDGIGATTGIQGGTYHVGMRVMTEEQAEKRRENELKAIRSTLEQRAKALKIDEPLDPAVPQRYAAQAIFAMQGSPGEPRVASNGLYSAGNQLPSTRAAAGVLRAIGAETLRPEGNRVKAIDMRSLDDKQLAGVRKALEQYAAEQKVWSAPFEPVFRMVANAQYVNFDDILERSLPLGAAKPDGCRVRVVPNDWGNSVQVEIMAGGMSLVESSEYLPRQRIYTDPGGETFPSQKANQIRVPLSDKVKRLEAFRSKFNRGELMEWDEQLLRLITDPWKNELIAFTRAQPMAAVADKLDLNLVAYLTDSLINHVTYDYYGSQAVETVQGDQVLSLMVQGGITPRKKGDWLIGYSPNPEAYLANQVDRAALGRFLTLARKPGALSFNQMLNARKELGSGQLYVARNLARLVRPGFDSLNPMSIEILDIFSKLKPGQLAQAQGTGIPVGTLGEEMEQSVRRFVGLRSRRTRMTASIPDDSMDAPPTVDDFRKARLTLTQKSDQGILMGDNSASKPRAITPYIYYYFQRFDDYRRYESLERVAQVLQNRTFWPARMDTLTLNIDFPRKRTQGISTAQYITDVSLDPLSPNQAATLIGRYLSGN